MNKLNIDREEFIKITMESETMSKAAAQLKMHFNTFKKYAVKFGVYNPNQGGKGTLKPIPPRYATHEILEGLHPHYQTYKLKQRLFKEGILKNQCNECGIESWNGKELKCELDHIDGDRTNHKLENLRILCPNCHSQTETFRSKNV